MTDGSSTFQPGSGFGQHRIERLLGRGGMGEVYEVEHELTGKRHALKLLSADVMEVPGALGRFLREAKVMARLEHPGIVRVDLTGEDEGRHWLRMELMSGREVEGKRVITLEEYVEAKGGRLPESEVKKLTEEILEALDHAHSQGLVHRDLKPANVLLEGEHLKIADFGLVNAAGADWMDTQVRSTVINPNEQETLIDGSGTGSRSRAIMGTYAYMSPEQKKGQPTDTRSDLYAIGLMVFRMLTGLDSPGMERPSELGLDLNTGWDAWLIRALKEKQSDRFPTAGVMKTALSFKDVTVAPVPVTKRTRQPFPKSEELPGSIPVSKPQTPLEKAGESGDADAQNKLGDMFYYGEGVDRDYGQAVKWFEEAARQGNATAQKNLAVMFYYGEGVSQDFEEAIKLFREAALQGNIEAQCNLAEMYRDGEGIHRDYEEAIKWFEKSARNGNSRAQNKLGDMYYYGEGAEEEHGKAYKYYRQAALQGDAASQKELAVLYYKGEGVEQDMTEAIKWFEEAARQGNAEAQFNLAEMFYDGDGVDENYEEAFSWFEKAAQNGHVRAQNKLGDMYYEGEGVDQDRVEAFNWFEKAARRGHAEARKNLGVMYYYGEGVEQDHVDAFRLFKEAAQQGHAEAQFNLAEMYNAGEGVHQDHFKAFKWFMIAAEQGHSDAQYSLGQAYENGKGVSLDRVEAEKWYGKAAVQGHAQARSRM